MAKMYAWSNFAVERNDYGQITKTIKPGESITQAAIGVDDAEWESLIESGAVREDEYPEDIQPNQSPVEYQRAKEAALLSGELSAENREELLSMIEERAEAEGEVDPATVEATSGKVLKEEPEPDKT